MVLNRQRQGEQDYLDDHVTEILNLIKDKKSQLWEIEKSSEISIWCAFASEDGQGGFIFSQSILQQISKFPVNLVVNLYPPTS